MATVQFKLNGKSVTFTGDEERMLLWILRTDLALTGAKYGCGEGLCGACTVLVNGEAVLSCQTPVKDVGGAEVVTIEGLAQKGNLLPIQQAFIDHDALQCGFCTSGMLMSCAALTERVKNPTEEQIRAAVAGNLCRCGTYPHVFEACREVAR